MPIPSRLKLLDKAGNTYAVTVPIDVNPDNVEDLMLGCHDGVVNLLAYQLVGDVFRYPDGVECNDGGKSYNFFRKIKVFDQSPELSQQEFGEAIKEIRDYANKYRVNRPELKTFEGHEVLKDPRGYYVKRVYPCSGEKCEHKVEGTQRLSFNNGLPSRLQTFEPDDKEATRARPASKHWLCSDCSVKHITPPAPVEQPVPVVVEPAALEAPNLPSEPVEEKPKARTRTGQQDGLEDDLRELMELSGPRSEVSAEYLKGIVYGMLRARAVQKNV